RKEWKRRDPATGLPGESIALGDNVGATKDRVWKQASETRNLATDELKEHESFKSEAIRLSTMWPLRDFVEPYVLEHILQCQECQELSLLVARAGFSPTE